MTAVWVLVLGAGIATARLNYSFGIALGSSSLALIFAAGDVMKTFLPTFLGTFLGREWIGTFPRRCVGWATFCFLVVCSVLCAMGMYGINRDATAAKVLATQQTYGNQKADRERAEKRIAELSALTPRETVEGQITSMTLDRIYTRTDGCNPDPRKTERDDSRAFCGELAKLRASLPTLIPTAEIQRDLTEARERLRKLEAAIGGTDLKTVNTDPDVVYKALARMLPFWTEEQLKDLQALLGALVTEIPSLLPWLFGMHGGHETPRKREASGKFKSAAADAPANVPNVLAVAERIELPGEQSLVAAWLRHRVQRRPGSTTPSSAIYADLTAYCGEHKLALPNKTVFGREMTRLGFSERRKIATEQHYVGIELVPARELRLAVSNTA